jgi:hypothetical protein
MDCPSSSSSAAGPAEEEDLFWATVQQTVWAEVTSEHVRFVQELIDENMEFVTYSSAVILAIAHTTQYSNLSK